MILPSSFKAAKMMVSRKYNPISKGHDAVDLS